LKLSQIFDNVNINGMLPDGEAEHVCADTRQITPDSIFFCLKGFVRDGHDFAAQAIERGAKFVVAERDMGLGERQIVTDDTHKSYALCCANIFGNPQRKLKMVGVTGTNGKTTVSHLIRDILRRSGYRVGLIGTISTDINGMVFPAKYTTPDPLTFYSVLSQMVEAGCEYAVMEVSSHGLDQKRVAGCRFEVGVFTNLTQDHLDYHGDMEHYFAAKKSLFPLCEKAVVNYDDSYGRLLLQGCGCDDVKSFSIKFDEANYTAREIVMKASGTSFIFVGDNLISRVKFPVPGEFSASNAMAAISACLQLGLPLETVAANISNSRGVPGRFEVLDTNTPYTVIRDYAHTPDGIEKMLSAIRAITDKKVTILFGCAGNRDRKKRRLMSEAASAADFIILTSDNPRREDVMQIIDDARPGLPEDENRYIIIPDRYQAIKWALQHCKEGEVLLLAGKGHEDYQVLSHATVHFDEREVVAELLSEMTEEK